MRRPHGNRARLGGALLAVAAALALLILPGLAASHKGHHGDHGDAGTIRAFDRGTGVLTVSLTNGGAVSGLVVRRTKIRCGGDRGHHHGLRQRKRGRKAGASSRGSGREDSTVVTGSEDGERRGRGEDPPGDDGTAPGRSEGPGQGAQRSDRCGIDDLVSGAAVKIAELVLTNGNAYFRLVGLAGQAPAGEPQPGAGEDAPAAG
jgi:hypothetical protein